jgi:hypothetical protein
MLCYLFEEWKANHRRLDTVYTREQVESGLREMAETSCTKCGGRGWVYGYELDDPTEDEAWRPQDTQYDCDGCSVASPLIAPHVNEPPRSKHDRDDVLTGLARAGQEWDAAPRTEQTAPETGKFEQVFEK